MVDIDCNYHRQSAVKINFKNTSARELYGRTANFENEETCIETISHNGISTENETSPLLSSPSKANSTNGKFSCQQILSLVVLTFCQFAFYSAGSIMAPFFPREASKKGVSTTLSGIVFSAYSVATFITPFFIGSLVGKLRPKVLIFLGITMTGICNILFGFLEYIDNPELFFWSCLICRVVEGIGAGAYVTASVTFTADIFPDNIGGTMGVLEVFIGLGTSVGPGLGGFLYDLGGYGLPFYTNGVLLLITLPLIVIILKPEPRSSITVKTENPGSWRLLRLMPVLLIYLDLMLFSIIWSFGFPTLEPHLRELDLSVTSVGLIFFLYSAAYAVLSPLWGYLADKLTNGKSWIVIFVGTTISSIGLLLLGPSPFFGLENTLWLNLVALTVTGISASMAIIPTFKTMLDFTIEAGYPDGTSTNGIVAAVWISSNSLGNIVGPILGAFLTSHFGFPVSTTVIAGLSAIMAFIIFIYFYFLHRKPNQEI